MGTKRPPADGSGSESEADPGSVVGVLLSAQRHPMDALALVCAATGQLTGIAQLLRAEPGAAPGHLGRIGMSADKLLGVVVAWTGSDGAWRPGGLALSGTFQPEGAAPFDPSVVLEERRIGTDFLPVVAGPRLCERCRRHDAELDRQLAQKVDPGEVAPGGLDAAVAWAAGMDAAFYPLPRLSARVLGAHLSQCGELRAAPQGDRAGWEAFAFACTGDNGYRQRRQKRLRREADLRRAAAVGADDQLTDDRTGATPAACCWFGAALAHCGRETGKRTVLCGPVAHGVVAHAALWRQRAAGKKEEEGA